MTISVVINADTRQGYLLPKSTVGDFGGGSLQGVRSADLLTEGLKNKLRFFEGYHNIQCILYIDRHEDISKELMQEIESIVYPCSSDSIVIFKEHDRTQYKWNDRLYLEAFKYVSGDYVVHFDMDSNAYRKEDSDIIERYIKWLEYYKYVCQPWDKIGDDMYWASTRFFICKRETLDLSYITPNVFINPLMGKHNPCLEHTIGILAGREKILYPDREDDDYIIFCWASYFSGLLKHLNNLPYEKVKEYILNCGLVGTHDIISKPISNE